MCALEGGDAGNEPAHGERGRRIDGKHAAHAAARKLGGGERDVVEGGADVLKERDRRRRRFDAAARALEQPLTEIILKQFDLLADGAVGDAEFARRRSDARKPRRRFEGAQSIERRQPAHSAMFEMYPRGASWRRYHYVDAWAAIIWADFPILAATLPILQSLNSRHGWCIMQVTQTCAELQFVVDGSPCFSTRHVRHLV